MARTSARPGRNVSVFFIGLAVAYGLVALIAGIAFVRMMQQRGWEVS